MSTPKKKIESIDEYISNYPEDVQNILQKIRKFIKSAAPDAKEAMSYQIPTFQLNGNLVHFAAYKKHIGFYPNPSGIAAFRNKLSIFEVSKGTIKFPLNKPIPYDLIKEIVEFRVKENLSKKSK